jgi:hypothetical protein
MIVSSVVLIVVAVVLLVLGVIRTDSTLLYASIVGTALAALALIVGLRQLPANAIPEADFDVRPGGSGEGGGWRPRPIGVARPPSVSRLDASDEGVAVDLQALADADPTVPADEPDEQAISEQDGLALAQLSTDVVVIDGRPRFHVDGCLHLLGFTTARLPVLEAVELGFTPCALCAPATALLQGRYDS